MVTAGLAFTLCLTWAIMPYNEVWNGVLFVYTRANANAVLVALNSRRDKSQTDGRATVSGGSVSLSTIAYGRGTEQMRTPTGKDSDSNGIFVQTETVLDKEYPL